MTPLFFLLALVGNRLGDGENLALRAHATASETYQDLAPEKAIDGDPVSRWSGIPGHNEGVWYQLEWEAPVRVSEVVLHQHDRYVKELDLELFEAGTQSWRTVQHLGRPDRKLPRVVAARFGATEVTKLRIGHITNGPSFTEVEVHATPSPPSTVIAGDLQGHILAMVSDAFGAAPLAGARVAIVGGTPRGAWSGSAVSDENGLVRVTMPPGLRGRLTVTTELDGER